MDGSISQLFELLMMGVIALLIFSALGLVLVRRNRSRSSPQSPHYPDAQTFRGQGEERIELPELIAAQYRVDFQFPDTIIVKVELIETATGASSLILLKSGSGVDGFWVQNPGRHLLHITPDDWDASWSLTIKAVGLRT